MFVLQILKRQLKCNYSCMLLSVKSQSLFCSNGQARGLEYKIRCSCFTVVLNRQMFSSIVLLQTPSMSKKTEHFETGGNKDSEETSLEEASEEMVRKRILASSPTSHRGNSPQGEFRPAIFSPDDLLTCRRATTNYRDNKKDPFLCLTLYWAASRLKTCIAFPLPHIRY